MKAETPEVRQCPPEDEGEGAEIVPLCGSMRPVLVSHGDREDSVCAVQVSPGTRILHHYVCDRPVARATGEFDVRVEEGQAVMIPSTADPCASGKARGVPCEEVENVFRELLWDAIGEASRERSHDGGASIAVTIARLVDAI